MNNQFYGGYYDEKTATVDFLGYSYENSSSICNGNMISTQYHENLRLYFEGTNLLLGQQDKPLQLNWTCNGEYDSQSEEERNRGFVAFADVLSTKSTGVIIREGIQTESIFRMIQKYRELIDFIKKGRDD